MLHETQDKAELGGRVVHQDDGILPLVRMILQPGRVPGWRLAEAGGQGRQHRDISSWVEYGTVEPRPGKVDMSVGVRNNRDLKACSSSL